MGDWYMMREEFSMRKGPAVLTVPRPIQREELFDFLAWLDLVKRKLERESTSQARERDVP